MDQVGTRGTAPAAPAARRRRSAAVTVLVALAAAGFAVFAALRGLGLERGWPLVPALAYTPYVLGAALLAATAAGLLRRWVPLAVLVAAAAVLAAAVVPRAIPFGISGAGGPELRVMSLNALGGGADVAEVVALVRDREVTVLALQEVTPDLLEALSEAGLDDLLPHTVDHSAAGVHGSSVHAALPLTDLGDAAAGTGAFAMPRAGMEVPGYSFPVEVVSVHPLPPLAPGTMDGWRDGLRALPGPGDAEPAAADPGNRLHRPGLRILAGDFNATLDHAELRRVLDEGYVSAATVHGRGLEPTWPTGGGLPGVTIDHVLVDESMGVGAFEVVEVTGSDHRAVLARVTLPEGR
ncbi:endonuclease/exonuclease/phosphatase family protein [Nocardiopsis tropica]|uniref:Endonuclease/exonuclease/phosphatase family protein n=1 Tax=Nocardiopsis tropica TaxID=109330 RepID=A0ABV2A1C3_9ACTN